MNSLLYRLYTVKNSSIWVTKKCVLLKKTQKYLNANIFVRFDFKQKSEILFLL